MQKRLISQKLDDENALKNEATRTRFIDSVTKNICDIKKEECNDKNKIVLKSLTDAAQATLPSQRKQLLPKETWKIDADLNSLFLWLTKLIKKRVHHLRNEKVQIEANIINDHANRKEVEQLF